MTISVVNIATNSGKTVTSLAITVPAGGVPAGSLILVAVENISVTPTVTDTAGNSYSHSKSLGTTFLFWVGNCLPLVSGNTITVSAASSTMAATAFYAVGVSAIADPSDVSGSAAVSTTTPTVSTSSGTTVSGELLVGILGTIGPSGDTFTQDSTNEGGFSASPAPVRVGTSGGSATTNATVAGGYVVWNSTGTATYAPTITSRTGDILIVTFKPDILMAQSWL